MTQGKNILISAALFLSVTVFSVTAAFAADSKIQADNDAINAACSAESATAGCGADKVGSGLLKCLHTYKKAHHEFKVSDGCKAAMKQRRADRKNKNR